jgi:hypothetical protein
VEKGEFKHHTKIFCPSPFMEKVPEGRMRSLWPQVKSISAKPHAHVRPKRQYNSEVLDGDLQRK